MKRFLPRKRPARILDAGCGTGRWGLRLLKSGFDVDFLDISEKMLGQVANHLGADFPDADSALIHASIDDLSAVKVEPYDLIVAQGDPLSCAETPSRALGNLVSLLAPKGTLIVSVDNQHAGYDYFLEKGDIDGLEAFAESGRTRWLTEKADERFPLAMFTPKSIRKLIEKQGLETISMIGKTVLPVRTCEGVKKNLLAEREPFSRLLKLEESLHSEEALLGRAAHLEVVARRPG
jgi:SAM-dependent methyltransferase